MIGINYTEPLTFEIPREKWRLRDISLVSIGIAILAVIFYAYSSFLLIPIVFLLIIAFLLFWILYGVYWDAPTSITIEPNGVSIIYHNTKRVERRWVDILWIDIWPREGKTSGYCYIKFDDNKLYSMPLSYESGKAVKEAYFDYMGRYPPNQDTYYKQKGGIRWFSGSRSE